MSKPEDAELNAALTSFINRFELVFDQDWDMTKDSIGCHIEPNHSFLNPGVADESNNWWNRGNLLSDYRELVKLMKERGIYDSRFQPAETSQG